MKDRGHVYGVYGIALHSEIPLPLPGPKPGALAQIELRTAPASFFADAIRDVALEPLSGSWCEFARLEDHSSYVRWEGVGEFLVSSDGGRIVCRQFAMATPDSFQVYLLGRALSFALVKLGFEPLHATVVVVDGEAIAFLGQSGYGKSTLAASFLDSGHQMLTDDLLLLQANAERVMAYPGPARIKLFPEQARRFLRENDRGVRMNTEAEKLIVPLDPERTCSAPYPLKTVYTLVGPGEVTEQQEIDFEPLSPRQAFLELLKNTFNRGILDSSRLKRQLHEAAQIVSLVPVTKLSFPRVLHQVSSLRETILLDLRRQLSNASVCGD